MNKRSQWAFTVTDSQRRAEVGENERLIRHIDAAKAAGLHALVDAIPDNNGSVDIGWLPFLCPAAGRAMGLDDGAVGALADLLDVNRGAMAWIPARPAHDGWYDLAVKTLADLRERFGDSVSTTAFAKYDRARFVRRLRAAKNALGIR